MDLPKILLTGLVFLVFLEFLDSWVLIFFPSYFKWTYGNPSAGPSAQLPRPAFLLPRKQVQNSSFRELPRSRFFLDFSRSASAVTRGASAKALSRGCVEVCYLYFRMGEHGWTIFHDPIFHTDGLGVFQCLRVKGLLPQSFREASAKNMNTFTKNILRPLPACVYHVSCKTITSYKAQYMSIYDIFICCS